MTAVTFPEVLTMQWLREKYTTKQLAPEAVIEEIISRSERDAAMNIWITPPSLMQLRLIWSGSRCLIRHKRRSGASLSQSRTISTLRAFRQRQLVRNLPIRQARTPL